MESADLVLALPAAGLGAGGAGVTAQATAGGVHARHLTPLLARRAHHRTRTASAPVAAAGLAALVGAQKVPCAAVRAGQVADRSRPLSGVLLPHGGSSRFL